MDQSNFFAAHATSTAPPPIPVPTASLPSALSISAVVEKRIDVYPYFKLDSPVTPPGETMGRLLNDPDAVLDRHSSPSSYSSSPAPVTSFELSSGLPVVDVDIPATTASTSNTSTTGAGAGAGVDADALLDDFIPMGANGQQDVLRNAPLDFAFDLPSVIASLPQNTPEVNVDPAFDFEAALSTIDATPPLPLSQLPLPSPVPLATSSHLSFAATAPENSAQQQIQQTQFLREQHFELSMHSSSPLAVSPSVHESSPSCFSQTSCSPSHISSLSTSSSSFFASGTAATKEQVTHVPFSPSMFLTPSRLRRSSATRDGEGIANDATRLPALRGFLDENDDDHYLESAPPITPSPSVESRSPTAKKEEDEKIEEEEKRQQRERARDARQKRRLLRMDSVRRRTRARRLQRDSKIKSTLTPAVAALLQPHGSCHWQCADAGRHFQKTAAAGKRKLGIVGAGAVTKNVRGHESRGTSALPAGSLANSSTTVTTAETAVVGTGVGDPVGARRVRRGSGRLRREKQAAQEDAARALSAALPAGALAVAAAAAAAAGASAAGRMTLGRNDSHSSNGSGGRPTGTSSRGSGAGAGSQTHSGNGSGSEDAAVVVRPATKQRFSAGAGPSRYCHVCGRSGGAVGMTACFYGVRSLCRKVVCEVCIAKYDAGWAAVVRSSGAPWACTHCRGMCPARARCTQYKANNELRRQRNDARRANLLRMTTKVPKASVSASASASVVGLADGSGGGDGGGQ